MDDEPAYRIAVTVVRGAARVRKAVLARAIRATLARHRVASADLSVAVVNDEVIARLNEQHLKHRGPTDVLTFDLTDEPVESGRRSAEGSSGVHAEIVVSVDAARREAARRGHDVMAELALYVVHGTLHLLGHDDHRRVDAERMHTEEDVILTGLGLGPIYGAGAR